MAETRESILIGMGWGAEGQLAIPSKPDIVPTPRVMEWFHNFRVHSLACGMAHSGIITDAGTLFMFGKAMYGRLGIGDEVDPGRPREVTVGTGQRVSMVACGAFHTCVVTAKGALFSFGRGDSGQLGLCEFFNSLSPAHVSIIHQKVTKVACGVDHTICCTAQGEMYGFGSNAKGQLGIGQLPQEKYNIPQRIDYQSYTVADGCSPTSYPSSLACGHSFTAMILDGRVFSWGSNEKGQCGTGEVSPIIWNPTPVALNKSIYITNLSCGLDHGLAVTEIGRVFTWGSCEYGQLGIASELLAITTSATNKHFPSPMVVKEALLHEHVATGCCGSYHSVVVTVDGKLFSWGLGDKGQLGKAVEGSGVGPYPYNVRIKSTKAGEVTSKVALLAAGGRHTIASLYCKPLVPVAPSVFNVDIDKLAPNLSASSSFFDVNNTISFDAHRIFLSRIPKLQSLLSDAAIQELRFPTVSHECMATVLCYLYTNKLPAIKDVEVAQLAHEWELHHLYCHSIVDDPISPGNLVDNSPLSIQRHLKRFVNSSLFSDVTFIFPEAPGTKIYAHKAILVARCEFFLLEFGGNFKESSQSEVAIPDTSPDSFLHLLHYLYSDEVLEQSDWVELLAMSNLYQITRLKNLCEQTIAELVDVDNVVALYEISQQCDTPHLMAFCDYFITMHYESVATTSDFKLKLLATKQQNFSEQFERLQNQATLAAPKGKCCLQ